MHAKRAAPCLDTAHLTGGEWVCGWVRGWGYGCSWGWVVWGLGRGGWVSRRQWMDHRGRQHRQTAAVSFKTVVQRLKVPTPSLEEQQDTNPHTPQPLTGSTRPLRATQPPGLLRPFTQTAAAAVAGHPPHTHTPPTNTQPHSPAAPGRSGSSPQSWQCLPAPRAHSGGSAWRQQG